MTFDYSRIIPKPLRDLVKRYTGRYKQASESATHGMRSYPCEAMRGYVILERSGEIVTVSVHPMRYLRLKHKWFAEPIAYKELTKLLCKRDRAFFPVFEIDRSSLAQMEQASRDVKPERTRLNNLVLP